MAGAARDGHHGPVPQRSRHPGAVTKPKEPSTIMTSNAVSAPVRTAAVLGLAVAALVTLTAAGAHAGGSDRVAGTYAVEVTLRDCASGAPAGPSFDSLVTLHPGGTITETPGGRAFAPGQRGAGHGAWKKIARHTYAQEVIALVTFDTPANLPGTPTFDPSRPVTPGFQAGWQTISHTITFADATNATSAGTNAFYTLAGVQYRTGCSTAALERVVAP
jgi:hypothetical protein